MCICINCNHIKECSTYYLIESKHEQIHLNHNPLFTPAFPIIRINISSHNHVSQIDWDLVECLSFVEKPNSWNLNDD